MNNLTWHFRIDMIVNEPLIVDIKSIEAVNEVRLKQVVTCLRLASKKTGILFNFNTGDISKSIFRKVNGL